MAQTLNSVSFPQSAFMFHCLRQRRSLCLPSILRRVLHHQRRLSTISTSSSHSSSRTDPIKDNDPTDILSARNLPLYQYIRKTIRQKTLPEIYTSKLQHHLDRFDGEMSQLQSAHRLDRESRVAVETNSRRNLAESEAEMINLLLTHDAETEVETLLDPNVAYVDILSKSSWLGAGAGAKLVDRILEMYFQLKDRNKWDLLVIDHQSNFTSIRIKGRSAFHSLKFETGLHEIASSRSTAVEVVVRPHFLQRVLPEVKDDDIYVVTNGNTQSVRVELSSPKLAAEWSEHKNVVRNKADAVSSLKQQLRAETWFADLAVATHQIELTQQSQHNAESSPPSIFDSSRYLPAFYGERRRVIRTVDLQAKTVIDSRLFLEDVIERSKTISPQNKAEASLFKTPQKFSLCEGDDGLLSPDDLAYIHKRLSLDLRRSLLAARIRAAYMTANAEEVEDLCRLNFAFSNVGSVEGEDEHRRSGSHVNDSQLLQIKCIELDEAKQRLIEWEEALNQTKRDLESKTQECDSVSRTLKERDAFIEKMTKGKRDLDALIKQERMEKFKKLDSERYSLTKWLKRQESSLENLIDARYSDRVDLSQDKFHVQTQLDRALSMIEQQQKDLKEGAVKSNDLTLQVGNLKNILESKDRQLTETQSVIDSLRRDASRNELLRRLDVAESTASVKTTEAEEARSSRDVAAKRVEMLTNQLSEAEGRHAASAETDKGKIEFLEMTVDNLQTLLVNKEQEKKEVVALERTSVESMKKQMRDYIKKHAEANMDKDRTIVKLEKEAETLKKELEMSSKREESLQSTLNRERSGREHSNFLVEEEKRAWVEEWERRQEQERAEWRQMERNLRERVYRLESENKEAKDTIENLIAFQQRKNRPE